MTSPRCCLRNANPSQFPLPRPASDHAEKMPIDESGGAAMDGAAEPCVWKDRVPICEQASRIPNQTEARQYEMELAGAISNVQGANPSLRIGNPCQPDGFRWYVDQGNRGGSVRMNRFWAFSNRISTSVMLPSQPSELQPLQAAAMRAGHVIALLIGPHTPVRSGSGLSALASRPETPCCDGQS